MTDPVEKIETLLQQAAVEVCKLRNRADPGAIPIKKYLRRFETNIDRMKNEFRLRCGEASGSSTR